jgi:tetratricopeptide (TPR) repeat protein
MKKPYLLIITAILCLVLTGGMSLAKDSDKEAIEAFKQAIKINPDYAKTHHNLGVIYLKLGMNKEALEAYKQAIRINPDYADAHFGL